MNDRSKCITQNYIASGRCCYRNKKKNDHAWANMSADRHIQTTKEFLKLNSKKTNNSTKKWATTEISPKEDMQV